MDQEIGSKLNEYKIGQSIFYQDDSYGQWKQGKITDIYFDDEIKCEMLQINEGEHVLYNDGETPILTSPKVQAVFEIDVDTLIGMTETSDVREALESEFGWVCASGLSLVDYKITEGEI